MDAETQRLIDAGDWRAAAERAEAQGRDDVAEALYLRLLDRTAAGRAAERAGADVRALSHYLEGGHREGVERLRIAALTSLSSQLPEILELLSSHGWAQQAAELASALGKLERAAELFVEARCPVDAAALMERMGRWREAGSLYNEHLRAAPQSVGGHLGLGRVLQRFERHREACDALWAARAQLVDAKRDVDSLELLEVRRRLAYSLASLGLAETTRRVLRDDPEGEIAARDLDSFLREVRDAYELGEGGVSDRYRVHSDASSPAGEAYGAHDSLLSSDVLIVPLSGPMANRIAWIRAQRALSDPPLPGTLTLVEADEAARYAVFDAPGGPSLAELLETSPPTGVQLGSLIQQLCDAVQGAHTRGVLHGALHPWCVFVRPGVSIAVTGFAQDQLGWQEATATVEGAESPVGYLAPEAAIGAPLDLGADFYGVGAIIWRAITGRQVPLDRGEGWLGAAPEAWRPLFDTLLSTHVGRRPGGHAELRDLITRAPWHTVTPATPVATTSPADADTAMDAARYRERSRSRHFALIDDTWLGRTVARVDQGRPLTAAQQDRLRVFAAPDAPGLQRVLACWPDKGRVDLVHERASATSWSALSEAERGSALAQVRASLHWLHTRGQAAGGIEAEDIAFDSVRGVTTLTIGRFVLQLPGPEGMGADERSLARLVTPGSSPTSGPSPGPPGDSRRAIRAESSALDADGAHSSNGDHAMRLTNRSVADDHALVGRYLRGLAATDSDTAASREVLQALGILDEGMTPDR